MVELFAIPGFGVVGISGIVLMIAGLTLGVLGNVGFDFSTVNGDKLIESLALVCATTIGGLAFSIWAAYKYFDTPMFGRMALTTNQQSAQGYVSNIQLQKLIGTTGIAFTSLRPGGKVEIQGIIYDAVAENGYIEKGDTVVVIAQSIAQLTVKTV